MERLQDRTPAGLSAEALANWGLIFLGLGLIGRGVIQTHILGVGSVSMTALLEQMAASQQVLWMATISLVLQAAESCAAPIFALLLVQGFAHTGDWKKYMLRLLALALVCEVPFDLAIHGKVWDSSGCNSVFAQVLSLVMLVFYKRFPGKSLGCRLARLGITLAAVLWGSMLSIDHGSCMAVLVAVLWSMEEKPMYRSYVGAAASVLCTLFSPFYLAAPMGFLAVHLYNGERDERSRLLRYGMYPAMLIAAAAAGMLV